MPSHTSPSSSGLLQCCPPLGSRRLVARRGRATRIARSLKTVPKILSLREEKISDISGEKSIDRERSICLPSLERKSIVHMCIGPATVRALTPFPFPANS